MTITSNLLLPYYKKERKRQPNFTAERLIQYDLSIPVF